MSSAPERPRLRLTLPEALRREIVERAEAALPNECCGLLAGVRVAEGWHAGRLIPLENVAASPILYEAEPKALLLAHREMRERGEELVGVYHSHPTSPPVPSRTDRERNGHGDGVAHLIVGRGRGNWDVRAWVLGEEVEELALEVSPPGPSSP